MNRVYGRIMAAFCFVLVGFLSGCSGAQKMAMDNSKNPQLSSKSIALFTLRTCNQYKPGFEPMVATVEIKSNETNKSTYYAVGKPHDMQKKKYVDYLVSVDLAPGRYSLGHVAGSSSNLLVIGTFRFPVDAYFEIQPESIVYLGHIDMTNRKKNEGEKRSGSIVPLIDQAVCGYSDGTFDVAISDRSEMDIPLFEKKYPRLQNFMISPALMNNTDGVIYSGVR